MLRQIEDPFEDILHQDPIEVALQTIEPYLVHNIHSMGVKEMTSVLVAYTHPLVSKRLKILDLIETKMI